MWHLELSFPHLIPSVSIAYGYAPCWTPVHASPRTSGEVTQQTVDHDPPSVLRYDWSHHRHGCRFPGDGQVDVPPPAWNESIFLDFVNVPPQ